MAINSNLEKRVHFKFGITGLVLLTLHPEIDNLFQDKGETPMKCPKCNFDSPVDTVFCAKCGTPLLSGEEMPSSPTKTLVVPRQELTTGTTFAARYQIIKELGKGGMGRVYKALDKEINETEVDNPQHVQGTNVVFMTL